MNRLRHDRGKKPRPEAISLIQTYVLRTVSKGEETGMRHVPPVKARHDGGHQLLANALVRRAGSNCHRTEEAHAAPAGGQVRPDKLTVDLSDKGGSRISTPAGARIVEIRPELLRLGCAEERAECEGDDLSGGREITLSQRANGCVHPSFSSSFAGYARVLTKMAGARGAASRLCPRFLRRRPRAASGTPSSPRHSQGRGARRGSEWPRTGESPGPVCRGTSGWGWRGWRGSPPWPACRRGGGRSRARECRRAARDGAGRSEARRRPPERIRRARWTRRGCPGSSRVR